MQYHKLSEPQRNETTQQKQIRYLWNDVNENAFHCSKQCHNWMCTTFYSKNANNDNNDKNNDNNEL